MSKKFRSPQEKAWLVPPLAKNAKDGAPDNSLTG
jgi:hypothetical protein